MADTRTLHVREIDWMGDLLPRGGLTVVVDWKTRIAGVARCADRDQYWRKYGRELALARLYRGQLRSVLETDEETQIDALDVVLPCVKRPETRQLLLLRVEYALEVLRAREERP